MTADTDPQWYKEFFEEMGIEYEDFPFTKNPLKYGAMEFMVVSRKR